MDRFFDFIERRKFGILATFALHMLVFMYLQIETYTVKVYYNDNEVYAQVDQEELIELDPENIEVPEDMQNWDGEVKNLTKDANDKREKATEGFSKSSVDSKVEQNVKDLEKQFFEEFNKGKEQGKTSSESSQDSKEKEKAKTSQEKSNGETGGDGLKTVFAGKTMVNYDLAGRYPHNKNDWYIRNPGYTCGSNSNGTVVVAIRVNQNGDVISARYIAESSSNANTCMIEKAQEYALKSRFAYKETAPKTQDGFITYNFVSQ